METVFGPEWIIQGLLAIGALGAFLTLVFGLGDVWGPFLDLRGL